MMLRPYPWLLPRPISRSNAISANDVSHGWSWSFWRPCWPPSHWWRPTVQTWMLPHRPHRNAMTDATSPHRSAFSLPTAFALRSSLILATSASCRHPHAVSPPPPTHISFVSLSLKFILSKNTSNSNFTYHVDIICIEGGANILYEAKSFTIHYSYKTSFCPIWVFYQSTVFVPRFHTFRNCFKSQSSYS